MKIEIKKDCRAKHHEWEHTGDYEFDEDCVYFNQQCNNCGKVAKEVFIYSCVVDENGKKLEK